MITLKNWINKCILKIPLIGEINDRFIYLPPKLADSYFGKTTKFGGVLEIFISKKKQWPINVGKIVKDVIFSSYTTLVFNVCFSCSRPSFWKRIGNYSNPKSIWFNVFFGFYEINAPLSGWDRPFGFIANNSNQLAIEDLIKLAKADWNFFSNYMYGVPFQNCVTASEIFGDEVLKIIDDKVIINNKQFIEAEISNIKVVSGYQSASEKLLNNDKLFSPIWRKVFGIHPPISDYLKSFITTNMKMKFYIRFEKSFDPDLEEICYNTYIYMEDLSI